MYHAFAVQLVHLLLFKLFLGVVNTPNFEVLEKKKKKKTRLHYSVITGFDVSLKCRYDKDERELTIFFFLFRL